MSSALIIVFREMLEMALVIGVVLAATEGSAVARRWIGLGVACGLAGAVLVALLADFIEHAASGVGERLFNAAILATASIMIAWTVIWMSQHGREMMARMQHVGKSVVSGDLPHTALLLIVFAAVMREGSEAVLFLYGAAKAGHGDAMSIFIGGMLGVFLGIATSFAIYKGLLQIPTRHLFQVTGWLLVLLAAGMASQASGHLVHADVLPALIQPLWDSSGWLPRSGLPGQFLHVLVGYDDRPSGMQAVTFASALILIAYLMKRYRSS